jgi:hypothetical protein
VGVEQRREALAEDGLRATGVDAAEAAEDQAQGDGGVGRQEQVVEAHAGAAGERVEQG